MAKIIGIDLGTTNSRMQEDDMFMTAATEFESPLHRTALAQLDTIAERLSLYERHDMHAS